MRSCATRSTNLNGPAQTGWAPKSSPASCAAFGDTIMPARSVSAASSGAKGADSTSLHRVVVDDLERLDRADLGLAVRAGQLQVALDAELDRGGVERLAVLELDALAQLDDEALVAVDPFPLGRELRDDVELGADIDELVAERGEDDAADIGARQRRVQQVGVFGEPDPQRLRAAPPASRKMTRRSPESVVSYQPPVRFPPLSGRSKYCCKRPSLASAAPGSAMVAAAGSSGQKWQAVACPSASSASAGSSTGSARWRRGSACGSGSPGRRQRARHLARRARVRVALARRIGDRHRREQRPRIGVQRRREERARRRDLDDACRGT